MRRAIVVGFDYHARFLMETVNAFSSTWHLTAFPSTTPGLVGAAAALLTGDALIVFGGPSPHPLLATIAEKRRLPVIIIWAGTDVIKAIERPHSMALIRFKRYVHWAVAPWLVNELRQIGIRASWVPVAAMRFDREVRPFPDRFAVLSYLPEPRREFYGRDRLYAIAERLPEITFNVVGAGEPDPAAPANVHYLGHVDDVEPLIDRSVALVRLPAHDGMSLLVLEALSRGRYVTWTNALPGVHVAAKDAEVIDALRALHAAHSQGALPINKAGFEFARAEFNAAKIAQGLEQALDAASPRSARMEKPRLRVAVSGLDFFVAELAALNERSHTPWDLRPLMSRTRFEILSSIWTLLRSDVWYIIGTPETHRWIGRAALFARKPRLMHWVGTDIQIAHDSLGARRQATAGITSHIAEVRWTAAELAEIGISAAVAPLPPRLRDCEVTPYPEKFTVLLYVPQSRPVFYGQAEYERLVAALPADRVRFIIVGGGEVAAAPKADVRNLGWQDSLQHVYAQSSVLIRFTQHDGLSLMVLEALARGRRVLWSHEFPFVTHVRSYEDILRETLALLDAHEAGTLCIQDDAASYVRTVYDPLRCLHRLGAAFEHAAGRVRGRKALADSIEPVADAL